MQETRNDEFSHLMQVLCIWPDLHVNCNELISFLPLHSRVLHLIAPLAPYLNEELFVHISQLTFRHPYTHDGDVRLQTVYEDLNKELYVLSILDLIQISGDESIKEVKKEHCFVAIRESLPFFLRLILIFFIPCL
jgi:hypothetical protein